MPINNGGNNPNASLLAYGELSSDATGFTITGLPDYECYRVVFAFFSAAATRPTAVDLRFNNDTGANYGYTISVDGGAGVTVAPGGATATRIISASAQMVIMGGESVLMKTGNIGGNQYRVNCVSHCYGYEFAVPTLRTFESIGDCNYFTGPTQFSRIDIIANANIQAGSRVFVYGMNQL